MKKFLKLLCLIWLATLGAAEAASLLPNGKQQFVDGNGVPYAGGTVQFYVPNTTVPKNTWQDPTQSTLNTNPVVLDADGRAVIYGEGLYRQVLRDSVGNLIWDQLTADPAVANSTWGGTSTGTANSQVVPTGNFTASDGQTYSFKAGFTNTAGLTLTVTGVGSYQVRKDTTSGPVALTGGEVTAGNVVNLVYDSGLGVFHMVAFPPTTVGSFTTLTVSGQTTLAGPVALSSTISPTIAADQNDWAPSGIASAYRVFLTSGGNYVISGIGGTHVNGQELVITNVGSTGTATFVNESTSSTAANRLTLAAPVVLYPGQSTTFSYDSTSSRWKQSGMTPAGGIGATYRNLVITVTSATALNLTADMVMLNSSVGNTVRLSTISVTCTITTSGINGLDTGSEASNTWYAIYIAYNPTTNVQGCLMSTSATSPTLPSGYTFANRFGWVRNDGSSNLYRTIQRGQRAVYTIGTNPTATLTMISGTSGSIGTPTWTAVSVSTYVPTTASAIMINVWGATGSVANGVMAAPSNGYGAYDSSTNAPPVVIAEGTSGAAIPNSVPATFVLESTNIYYASSYAATAMSALGWVDNLN